MRQESAWRRTLAVGVLISIIAAGVSAATYASGEDELVNDGEKKCSLKVTGQEIKNVNLYRKSPGDPSDLDMAVGLATPFTSLGDMLEQEEDARGTTNVEWFQTWLDGTKIRDSSDLSLILGEGQEIPYDAVLSNRLRASFHTTNSSIQSGDSVSWNLGRFPGLTFSEEEREKMVLSGYEIADVILRYEKDGTLLLLTTFTENVDRFYGITVTYEYKSEFKPVSVRTPLPFRFPGIENPIVAMLLPTPGETDSSTEESSQESESSTESGTESSTGAESSTEIETSTELETSSEAETTTQETSMPSPTVSGGSSGGGSSPSIDRPHTTKASIEESTTSPETTAQVQEPETKKPDASKAETKSSKEETVESAESEEEGQLSIEVDSGTDGTVQNGELLTFFIHIKNDGDQTLNNVLVRDYLPQHTTYLSASNQGTWGIQDGIQRVTWKLDTLEPGESLDLGIQVQVFPCTPKNYRLENKILWQDGIEESVHSSKDPKNFLDVQEIIVG